MGCTHNADFRPSVTRNQAITAGERAAPDLRRDLRGDSRCHRCYHGATLGSPDMSDETPTIRRTGMAHKCALASLLRSDKPGTAGPVAGQKAAAAWPAGLLGLGQPRADRADIPARAACITVADETAWRRAWHAVELCQRVAELAARR